MEYHWPEYRMTQDQQIGELISDVRILMKEVGNLREEVASLRSDIDTGRGWLIGIIMASGGIGALGAHAIEALFK